MLATSLETPRQTLPAAWPESKAGVPPRSCPICGCDNRREPPSRYSRPPWLIKHCASCEFTYLENPPGYEALEHEFAWERTKAAEAAHRHELEPWLHRASAALWAVTPRRVLQAKIVRLVRRYVEAGPLLDLGCGKGRTGIQVGRDYVPYGIEISNELASGADYHFRQRGGRVINSDALSGLMSCEKNYFTGVVMKSYLEHETNPQQVLEAARRVMRPGAALIIKVPNYASWNRRLRQGRWCGFRYPDHVNYFTPRSLVLLLVSSGFVVERFQLRDRWPLSDNQWIVVRKR